MMNIELINMLLIITNLIMCLTVAGKVRSFNRKLEKIEKLAKTSIRNPKLARKLLNETFK
tara:strand:- start:305 stop:484 length:180 start_codon:yes stop_codon:yes gene_type:complete